MKQRTRKILFFILLLVFIVLAPILVLYVQGYRFDLANRKLTQTGGLFLKTIPKQAQIYLDGESSKRTDFFFGSALIENLLPKKYKISVQKEGFHPWEKDLEVKEREVTEARNIILFPENPYYRSLAGGIQEFWFSPNQRKVVLKEKEEDSWALKLYDLDRDLKSHLIIEDDISLLADSGQAKKGIDLFKLEFSEDERDILLEVTTAEQLKYFVIDIGKSPPFLEETENPLEVPENIIAYQEFKKKIYYLDSLGHIYETDKSFSTKQKVTLKPFPLRQETEYKLYIFPEWIFLQEENTLYLLNQDTKSFEKFLEQISSLKISPSQRKLVYFSENEIWVLFLKEQKGQLKRTKGERVFLLRLSKEIKDVFWINSEYLIFNTEDDIKIIETDNRDRINTVHLAEFENSKIFWNQRDKKLYVLDKGNLLASDKLIQ